MTRIKPMREMSLDAGRFDATSALDQIDDLRRQFADLGRRFDRLSRRK
jgi:hypothetical protein